MVKTVLSIITFLSLCIASFAQDAAYYNAIQKGSSFQVQPPQFKKMEENALMNYSRPETYELLATSFGNTTEKVWAVIYGAIGLKNDVGPLSIQKLTEIRKNQLSLWNQRKLPQTELVRRQEAILSAGHFDAYNYWLFKGARPEESNAWFKERPAQLQAWLDWQGKNKFNIQAPDFQRLYLLRGW